ncbi:molybdopterin molybdenumtransferase MoeA [Paenibacillus sp. JMULE4]|uniref:molybdopterin molybdotransferase MoeA n=1 Tax=Paenibacillus sp. JMULE4 TaxID=2518342 RepID=UPI0015767D5D|nr:gephyrin-like molybdotransferase Glp [Paenibacillus sp. JMULE4]NTZ19255.1 molybdopterin molybdenumtransferase MoeA [Paenibacillus sp. JMULE4]
MGSLRFGRRAVTLEEAQRQVLQQAQLMKTEEVPLEEAFGRRLAQDMTAHEPVPHFRRSGVDGYAVRAVDTTSAAADAPIRMEVTEMIPCGWVPTKAIGPGQAARIMTGAVVPEGADAVIMLEMTDRAEDARDGTVGIRKAMKAGENITPIGQEVSPGAPLLERGCIIGPGEAAILATFGFHRVPVFQQPKVAIFSTGSELLPVDSPLAPGKIRGSNSYMLACQVKGAGGLPQMMPILPDEAEVVEKQLLAALEWADIVITTGGVSVGDKDVLVDLFERWDGTLLFNKVSMRPGSPTSCGMWHGKPLFALSGNPGASYVGFELLVRPFMKASLGANHPLLPEAEAFLDVDYSKGSAYPRYVRGTSRIEGGMVKVRPAGLDKSSIMVSIKDADCLICIPSGGRGAAQGEKVRIMWLSEN